MDKDKTIHEVASYICEKYDILLATFNEITAYGKEYFEQKRFHEHHAQQQNRYRLYGNYVKDVYAKTQSLLQENLYNVAYWKDIKNEFSHLIKEKPHRLNSETFYNSITRKVFFDKSFNADIEYFDYTDYKPMPKMDKEVFDVIDVSHFSPLVIKQIIKHFQFTVKFEDIDRDCQKIFDEVAPSIIHQKSKIPTGICIVQLTLELNTRHVDYFLIHLVEIYA